MSKWQSQDGPRRPACSARAVSYLSPTLHCQHGISSCTSGDQRDATKACQEGEITPPGTSVLLPLHEGAILTVQRLHTFPQDSAAQSPFNVLCERAAVKPSEYGCQDLGMSGALLFSLMKFLVFPARIHVPKRKILQLWSRCLLL